MGNVPFEMVHPLDHVNSVFVASVPGYGGHGGKELHMHWQLSGTASASASLAHPNPNHVHNEYVVCYFRHASIGVGSLGPTPSG